MTIGTITKQAASGGVGDQPSSMLFADQFSFTGDSSYPTGGTAGFEAAVRLITKDKRTVVAVLPIDCGGYLPQYDRTNDKLKVYQGDNDNAADAPFIEVANTTNLSGVTFKVLVLAK
jgi:hypothetical protein